MTIAGGAGWWEATMVMGAGDRHAGGVAPPPAHRRTVFGGSSLSTPPRLDVFRPAPSTFAVRVADADPPLLGGLDADLAAAAAHQLVAPAVSISEGEWDPPSGQRRYDGWLGMLVLAGLLVRRVDIDGLCCCELLGPGDVLRPWDEDGSDSTLATRTAWRVVQPARVALLDAGFARRACRWPTVVTELMHRSLMRSRSLSVLLAATQARRADVRLRTLFWHLADRWGRVTPDGVRIELLLTHTVIAQLTGMRRPTVSLNLAKLERTGEILRVAKGEWIIRPPLAADQLAA